MMLSPCELQANGTLHAISTGKSEANISQAFWPKMASKVISERLIFTNFLTCILFIPLTLKYLLLLLKHDISTSIVI